MNAFISVEGDITINQEWIEYHVKKCDVVLPLVAIATPATYVLDPLRVFELDFEANLPIVRAVRAVQSTWCSSRRPPRSTACARTGVRRRDVEPRLGPINKPRWIYSCSKQLLDRVIHAYGMKQGLKYTLFRPFNWIGPKLDNILEPKEGSSRVLTQFIGNILRGKDIQLVDGGQQKRAFTYIDDGIDALIRIIENKDGVASGRIFNIGNPANDFSVRELAETMLAMAADYPEYAESAKRTTIVETSSDQFYGEGYQDMPARKPLITDTMQVLGWAPQIDMRTALHRIFDYYRQHVGQARALLEHPLD